MPVIVMLDDPSAAVLFAVSVSTVDVVDDDGLKDAVTPLGKPDALKTTLPAKPPVGATVIVDVPLVP